MTDSIERRLIAAGGSTRKGLVTAIVLGFGGGMATIVQAVLLARIVTAVVLYHTSWTSLSQDLIGLVGLFFLRSVLTYGAEVAAYHAAAAAKVSLRKSLLQHVFRLGPAYLANERSGELAASLLDGIETLEPFLARYLPQMALVVMLPMAILAVVFRLDLISGLVLLVSGPIIPLFMVLVGHQAEAINRRQWRKLLSMSAHFLDAVQGITTLKLFGRVRDEIELITRISDDYRRTTMASLRVAFLTSAVLEFFASLSIALAAVLFGARLIHGDIGFFSAFLVLLLVPEFFLPLRALATHYHARMRALAAAQQVQNFRTRIVEDEVWLYQQIHGSSTVDRPNGTFGFAYYRFHADIHDFVREAAPEMERVRQRNDLERSLTQNLIRFSALPWFNFSSISHARNFAHEDSAPMITFGKIHETEGRRRMPVSIHAHHALADGLHVAQFVEYFQGFLDAPESLPSED
jgi:ABC-type transport system involved in cytochrome bd biosynthesis fused ATPase/permease subunit